MEFNKEIIEFLVENFDLSEIEAQLYVGLLKKGPSTVMGLARFTEINRATTHINLESLIEKGLVTQSKKPNSKRRILIAEDPQRLEDKIEKRRRDLERIDSKLPNVLDGLNSLITNKRIESEVEVKYYRGKSEVENIYDEVVQAKEIRSYVNVEKVLEVFPENIKRFELAHKDRDDMYMWEILNADNLDADSLDQDRYKYKYFPEKVGLSALDYIIYDGKFAIITAAEEPNAVVIKNKELYDSQKSIYDFIWSLLPDPNNN